MLSNIWEIAQIFSHIWGRGGRLSYMTFHPIPSNFLIRGNIWVLGSNPQSFETAMNKQVHVLYTLLESIEEEVVCPPVEFRKQLLLTEEWDMKTFVCVQCARCAWEWKGRK